VAGGSLSLVYLLGRGKGGEFAPFGLTKKKIAQAIRNTGTFHQFPGEIELPIEGKPERAIVQYAFDPNLQEEMTDLFRDYRPDYGSFVAVDASTGRVLAMISYSHGSKLDENLALKATFPSASVFKVVTAAAAIAERNFSADTVIPFNGRNHTLYRSNVLKNTINRWTRYMTLKEAFARSVNTVFGRIGAYTVGAAELREYASRFGFNRAIAADVPLEEGRANIPDDAWEVAEAASGFTQDNTMSPLQGAMIAAAIVNDGVMMEPYAVQSIHRVDGTQVYEAHTRMAGTAVDSGTAAEIRALMRETVTRGTSRGSFKGFFRRELQSINVGGKTGSLTGHDPKGKYDWFVGYAENGPHKIAMAALTVHEKLWRVKSSYLARRAIENYFKGREIAHVQTDGGPKRGPSHQ
jgi:cell division protein FtsI/penicillin-binding protein 2